MNLAVIQIQVDLQDPARQRNCKLRASLDSIDDVPLPRCLVLDVARPVLAATDHVRRMESRVQCPPRRLLSGSVAQQLATAAGVAETRGGGAVSERLCSANRTVSGH